MNGALRFKAPLAGPVPQGRAEFQKACFPPFYIPLDRSDLKNVSVMTVVERRNVLSYLRFMLKVRNPIALVITRMGPTLTFRVWDLSSPH